MSSKSAVFTGILILWMGASTYWYVCKIKEDCKEKTVKETNTPRIISSDTIKVEVNIQKTETDERNELLKEKLSKGIIISKFPYNSAEYTQFSIEFNNFVRDTKTYLQLNAGENIEIIGYTDNKGSFDRNIELSRKRALFIKDKLLNEGINPEQIIIKAEGENNPLGDNKTESGRAKNRRVEIRLSKN